MELREHQRLALVRREAGQVAQQLAQLRAISDLVGQADQRGLVLAELACGRRARRMLKHWLRAIR